MKSVRIGAGLGFYGDSWRPVRASIERGGVQYIASDHLAELTLAILQKDRQKDPSAGYARDCVPMLTELWPLAAEARREVRDECRRAQSARRARGDRARVPRKGLQGEDRDRHRRLDLGSHRRTAGGAAKRSPTWTPAPTSRRARADVFANAYLGAQPIAEALAQGADIVLTGRVADAALSLGPLCTSSAGTGTTGTGSRRASPSATCSNARARRAAAISARPANGPRCQNFAAPRLSDRRGERGRQRAAHQGARHRRARLVRHLRQQLLYEVHNPHAYYSPDVVLDMGTLELRRPGQRPRAHHRRRAARSAPRR